jgi:hypothetical protein
LASDWRLAHKEDRKIEAVDVHHDEELSSKFGLLTLALAPAMAQQSAQSL